MGHKDEYYNRAKQEGYRSRSAYKLIQIDDELDILNPGDVILDLGAAPGGWLQVASERVGSDGTVIGVDRSRIEPIPEVETIRGDVTDATTIDTIQERLNDSPTERSVDVLLSDMAPNMTGEYEIDHARSIHLARIAADVADQVLKEGGQLVVKVFDGPDLKPFREDLSARFDRLRAMSPAASRDQSSERYLIASGRIRAPVEIGDELTVEIVSEGSEGDGVARIDGYTIFVPGTEVGETVEVRISDLKPRFGFATRTDES